MTKEVSVLVELSKICTRDLISLGEGHNYYIRRVCTHRGPKVQEAYEPIATFILTLLH
jgi:hypothetical protein